MSSRPLPGSNILMVTGVAATLFGVLLLLSPAAVGGAVVRFVALALVLVGVVQLLNAMRPASPAHRTVSAVLGAIVTAVGVLVWLYPELGSGFLTALLMIFFAVNAVWKLSTAWRLRPLPGWGWVAGSGLLSLLLAWLLWKQWPLSGAWAIGVLVGIDLLVTGLALIRVARSGRRNRGSDYVGTINL